MNGSKLIVAVALVVLLGGAVLATVFLTSPQGGSSPSSVTADWNEIVRVAKDKELSVFISNELDEESEELTEILRKFEQTTGVRVRISRGHWSGVHERLLRERLANKPEGTYDVVLLGDESMGRAHDSGFLWKELASRIQASQNVEPLFLESVHGVKNQGGSLPIWVDQYVIIHNTLFKEKDDLPEEVGEYLEWLKEAEGGEPIEEDVFPGRFGLPDPMTSDSGLALLMMTIYEHDGYDQYHLKPHNRELSAKWISILAEEQKEPELEEEEEEEGELPTEEEVLEEVAGGELWVGFVRLDRALRASLEGKLPSYVKSFIPEDGSLISGGHIGIPFNAKNKAGALVLANYLLSEEAQLEFVEELGKYPSLTTIDDDDIPAKITGSSLWIPIEEASEQRLMWPFYQYRTELGDLWRKLAGE